MDKSQFIIMTKLSVNINKIATLRNARGGNIPNVLTAAINCQLFGADGITVHPRPDERHIRYRDVLEIKPIITTEFNIEGYPSEDFINLVLSVKPDQVTLVPDAHDAITSNAGWDTLKNRAFLTDIVSEFRKEESEHLFLLIPIRLILKMLHLPEPTELNFILNHMPADSIIMLLRLLILL